MNHKDYITTLVIVLSMLLLSMAFTSTQPKFLPEVEAQQMSRDERNWEWVNHDSFGSSFNPQSQINEDNVKFLEMKWLFPYRGPDEIGPSGRGYGSGAAPLIVDGIVYVVMNDRRIIAMDADNGDVVWTSFYGMDIDRDTLPANHPFVQRPFAATHVHALSYYSQFDWLIPSSYGSCNWYAIDAKTGEVAWHLGTEQVCGTNEEFGDPLEGIVGSLGNHGFMSGAGSHSPQFLDNIMFLPVGGGSGNGGRSFVTGFDMSNPNNPQRLYRTWVVPHANGDPNWAIDFCNAANGNGWYFEYSKFLNGVNYPARDREPDVSDLGTRCTDVDPEIVKNDWINLKEGTPWSGKRHTASTVAPVWGNYPLDPETGIVYMGWGDVGPYTNSSYKYGPNVPGSGITAFNVRTGELVWWYSAVPHDVWDYDCSWSGMLAESNGKKVFIEGCKNGIVYALDAATGEPVWVFDPPTIVRNMGTNYGVGIDNSPNSPDACCDITVEDMGKDWFNYPSLDGGINNCFTSCLEADLAYDGERVYLASFNYFRATRNNNVRDFGNNGGGALPNCERCFPGDLQEGAPLDSTGTHIYAVDVNTGKEVWKYKIPGAGYRGGITVMGDIVMVYAGDGNLHFVDAKTGEFLHKIFFGIPVNVQATIGANNDGEMQIYLHIGGGGGFYFTNRGLQTDGNLAVFGLPDSIPLLAKNVEIEVREVIKEVEVPVETISPISYVIIGLGVILIVLSGIIYQRKK